MDNSSKNIFKAGFVLNDKWVIIEFIGKGAMGEVYRAHQLNFKREVAIKVISQEMLKSSEKTILIRSCFWSSLPINFRLELDNPLKSITLC